MPIGLLTLDPVLISLLALALNLTALGVALQTNRALVDAAKRMETESKLLADANAAMAATNEAGLAESRRLAQTTQAALAQTGEHEVVADGALRAPSRATSDARASRESG
jgi:hypothetical protein